MKKLLSTDDEPDDEQRLRFLESRILIFGVSYFEQTVAGMHILRNENYLKKDYDGLYLFLTCKKSSSLLETSSCR